MDAAQFRRLIKQTRVQARTAASVQCLYDRLQYTEPPEKTARDQYLARRARTYAARHRWAWPGAWDDAPGEHWIDDPAAKPSPDGGPWQPRRLSPAELAEEVEWLCSCGVTLERAAIQLGVTVGHIQASRRRIRAAQAQDTQNTETAAA
jgi:hypothetical protein